MSFELVIFDCDGVLVDSEQITNRVFCKMLNDLGLEVTLEDMFERFVGHSTAQCIEILTELLGAPPPEDFVPTLRHRIAEALEAGVEPVAGVVGVLDRLTIPYCVASSGEPAKMRLTLGKTGLLSRFEGKIFSVAEVNNPKPAPDVFLHAAAQMGVDPKACAVIEDTPTGVKAGVAAGMYVYGVAACTPEHRLKTAGAHEIFSNMEILPQLFAEHG
ncbi:MAG: HAD family hydrolase [Leptolyngbyaceae cyanobacterium]